MKYKITISGSGGRFGVGGLTSEQTSFWSMPWYQEDHLENVLEGKSSINDLLDDGAQITPEAMITKKYYELNDCGQVDGVYEATTTITVVDEDLKEIFKGSLGSYCKTYENNLPENVEFINESDELYVGLLPTQFEGYLFWKEIKNGAYVEAEVDTDLFDPCKLSYSFCDLNGEQTLVNKFKYDGKDLVGNTKLMKLKSKVFTVVEA